MRRPQRVADLRRGQDRFDRRRPWRGPRLGVKPDLITLAKSIGGGLPLAAFGGTEEVMQVVVDNRMAHFGTYNGNPLCMARPPRWTVATEQALAAAEQVNDNAMEAMDTIIREYELPPTPSDSV